MIAAAIFLAVLLSVAALPLIMRIDSAFRLGLRRRVLIEGGRLALAAAAAAVLVTAAWRLR